MNPMLHVHQYPILKAENLFATLAGKKKFINWSRKLSQAHQQVLLHPDDCKHTTHLGLFQYACFSFGIIVFGPALSLVYETAKFFLKPTLILYRGNYVYQSGSLSQGESF